MNRLPFAALLAAPFVLPAAASPQAARVPAATVQRVMSSEFAFCGRAESASAGDLDALDAEIRGAIDQAQRRVNSLVTDSVAAAKRLTDAQTRYDEVDGRLSPLQIERNSVQAQLKPIDDELARIEGGTAQPGQLNEHAQLMASQTELQGRIAFLTAEVEKVKQIQQRDIQARGDSVQDFLQGLTANEGPVADLRRAQEELKGVIERLREIRRETIPIRFGAQYTELHRKLADLERRIAEVEAELDTARRARDTARTARENFDLAGLEMAHEENLYASLIVTSQDSDITCGAGTLSPD